MVNHLITFYITLLNYYLEAIYCKRFRDRVGMNSLVFREMIDFWLFSLGYIGTL